MAKRKKFRLKKQVGKYLALTSVSRELIIKGGEVELSDEEYNRAKKYVEEVPVVTKRKKSVSVSEEPILTEDN